MEALDVDRMRREIADLKEQVRQLRRRAREPEDVVRAIRDGEVDAFVVAHADGERIYRLRTADELYRAVVAEMNEAAVVLDAAGVIVYANPHFAQLVGAAPGSVPGTPVTRYVTAEGQAFFDYLRQEAADGTRREIDLLAAGGEPVPVHASMSRIRIEDGDVFGLVLTDLREQRRRLELVAESHRKDEFMAMLAHELRNPLAPIRNALALLGMPGISASSLDMSRQIIDRQVNQLVRILDDLLDVQRFTHGVIVLKTEPTDLALPIESALDAIRSTAAAKSQRIEVERPADPLPVLADAARMTQIVSNLLVNAVKYSPPRSSIRISWGRDGPRARIRIADEGIGMEPELLPRIFEPFVQGDRDLSRSQGGLGVGLTLVKRLIELHGGTVTAASAGPGKGSEFVVHLPLLAQAAGLLGPAPRPPAPRRAAAARRVLVVDDNEDSAVSLCALLNLSGHQASLAHDGVEALRLAPALAPQVVILDLGLPGMDGYEVARRLREIAALEGCRLVALTGYGSSQDRSRTRAAGFAAHLVKPVELDALLDVIAAPSPGEP